MSEKLNKCMANGWITLLKRGVVELFHSGPRVTFRKTLQWYKIRQESRARLLLEPNEESPLSSQPRKDVMEYLYTKFSCMQRLNHKKIMEMEAAQKLWSERPLISVIMFASNTFEVHFRTSVASILMQIYPNWELVIIDCNSTDIVMSALLDEYKSLDSRIRVVRHSGTNKYVAYNEVVSVISSQYVMSMNADDVLTKDALWQAVSRMQEANNIDLIYFDHDEISADGITHCNVQFKPDWSPELVLSYDYIGPFRLVSRKVFAKLNYYRTELFEFAEYDFLLRSLQLLEKVVHIPIVLGHKGQESTDRLKQCDEIELKKQGIQMMSDYFETIQIDSSIKAVEVTNTSIGPVFDIYFKHVSDLISIIIPTKDRYDLISRCIDSLLKLTQYPNFEIILIDTGSTDTKVLEYYRTLDSRVTIIVDDVQPFSFARVNNEAAKVAHGEYCLFLNNDTEIIDGDWLTQMRGTFLLDKNIAGVGARLLYENRTIQHAGVILGIYGTADHACRGLAWDGDGGYLNYANSMRNYSACTAACLLVRKDYFNNVGGFDEKLALAYNDVDLCLKFVSKGGRIVYNPHATLFHFEMSTRTVGEYQGETQYLKSKWGALLNNDPYYNMNLTKRSNSFLIKDSDEKEEYSPIQP